MSVIAEILLMWGLLAGVVVTIIFSDRIIVLVLRGFDIPAFPEARWIALLIYQHPEQWTCGTHKMLHPKVGEIWTANASYGLQIETRFGAWKPNWIERRIIREAVDWRIKGYVRDRLAHALNGGLLP